MRTIVLRALALNGSMLVLAGAVLLTFHWIWIVLWFGTLLVGVAGRMVGEFGHAAWSRTGAIGLAAFFAITTAFAGLPGDLGTAYRLLIGGLSWAVANFFVLTWEHPPAPQPGERRRHLRAHAKALALVTPFSLAPGIGFTLLSLAEGRDAYFTVLSGLLAVPGMITLPVALVTWRMSKDSTQM